MSKVSENERERESCMNLSREIIRKTNEKRKENERFGGGRKKKKSESGVSGSREFTKETKERGKYV